MKTTFAYILFTCLMCINIFAQFTDRHHKPHNKQNHDLRFKPHEQLRERDENTAYKLKIGAREMPINTNSGKQPNEKLLEIIKNTLTEDFLVNDDTTGRSSVNINPVTVMDGLGNFVIAWMNDNNGYIYFQRYNSDGLQQGIIAKVNDFPIFLDDSDPVYLSSAMDYAGNFVIAWMDNRNGDYSDIYYQRFNSLGAPQGVNTKVNDDAGSAYQYLPTIAMDVGGNFVIAWGDERIGGSNIYYQRYNSVGIPQGVNTKANNGAASSLLWYTPTISIDGGGNFVIAWRDDRNGYGNPDIYYQRYNSNGVAQGINTKANDDAGSAYQWYPTIAMDGGGNFVVAWVDYRNDGGNFTNPDLYFQRYNSLGTAQGVNTKANDDGGSSYQGYPTIAIDGAGNFVITWADERNGNYDIYYQRYNSNGVTQGINTKTNDDAGTADQWSPTIAMYGGGNFVIAWGDRRNTCGWLTGDIYFQQYNSAGTAQGVNTKVNGNLGIPEKWDPTTAMDGGGNFVIAWMDDRDANHDIYYQRYNSVGTAQGVNTKVNNDTGCERQSYPAIAMDSVGNFMIVWEDDRNYPYQNIYYQRFNSVGTPQGVNIKANDDAGTCDHYSPTIAMNAAGNFVIAWTDERDGYPYNIYYQRYNSLGTPQGVNTKVNDDSGSAGQWSPTIAMDGAGNFVIAWVDGRNGNDDIYYQQFNSIGVLQGVNIKVNDDTGNVLQREPTIAMDGAGNFVIAWEDRRNVHYDIYYQRYNSSGVKQGINTKANDDIGSAEQYYPTITMDGVGNFVIVWEDYRYGVNNQDIIGQRYYANGTPNGINYRIVADGPNYGETLPVVAANNNKIIFSWMDNRRSKGWDIYGKQVDWSWGGVPVELTTFEAKAYGNKVHLNWTTVTETNNYGFEVERKVHSQQSAVGKWERIGFVPGNGNSNSPKHYTFEDTKLNGGSKYFYRLKQIDNNGSFEYSKEVEVNLVVETFALSQNYPNPFNPSTKIGYSIACVGAQCIVPVQLKIYDILGNEVATLVNELKEAGNYEVEFNPASSIKHPVSSNQHPASGVYFYQLKAGEYVATKKMLLLR